MSTSRTEEICFIVKIDVLITPRSILLIWEISIPISLAKSAWVNPFDFLSLLRF